MSNETHDIRTQARKRIELKRDFWRLVWTWVGLSFFFVVVWFLTSPSSYFWPAWPIAGIAVGVFFTGLSAYGPGKKFITDDDIDAEIQRSSRTAPRL